MSPEPVEPVIDAFEKAVTELAAAKEKRNKAGVALRAALLESGWQKLDFVSEYFGHHPEYGEGDEHYRYFFRPEVAGVKQWEGVFFQHGHHGGTDLYVAFHKWLETVKVTDYLLFTDPDDCDLLEGYIIVDGGDCGDDEDPSPDAAGSTR